MSKQRDDEYSDWLDHEVSQLWLRGFKVERIARDLGLTVRRINQLLEPHRVLLANGEYDQELARLKADGVTDLPDALGDGKPGRPPVPFTQLQIVLRAEHLAGVSIVESARRHDTYPQIVRYALKKSPSLLNQDKVKSANEI